MGEEGSGARPDRLWQRRRGPVLVLVGALALAVAGGGLWWRSRDPAVRLCKGVGLLSQSGPTPEAALLAVVGADGGPTSRFKRTHRGPYQSVGGGPLVEGYLFEVRSLRPGDRYTSVDVQGGEGGGWTAVGACVV